MKTLDLRRNVVLFGADPTEGILAVEPVGDDIMRIFLRVEGRLGTRDEPFTPFLLLEDEALLQGFKLPFKKETLALSNPYRVLVLFDGWGRCLKARDHLQRSTGEAASSPQAPYLFLSDPVHQHLLLTGKTLFKGMGFEDLHRLAIDIETACATGYEFSNPRREEDRILSIALMDNRGYAEVLFGGELTEGEMIEALGDRIRRIDPDVLEGHNLFNFDLEYIVTRAKMRGVPLPWGRDGSEPRIRRSRFTVAERIIDYTRLDLFGRHVVDTMFLLQYYDVSARELESYGLKSAAIHFGLADEERTYIDREKIAWYYEHDPEALKRYNLDDVRETLALSELLGYPFFLQTSMFPFTYQNIFVRGNATKINALFLREYLRMRASVPKPKGKGALEGGYTDMFIQGVVSGVVHCDVASLYPSIMLSYGMKPGGDSLDVFLSLLRDLRRFRLEAKRMAQQAQEHHERDYYEALQQTFKVLINSFYGYLGTEVHHFSDPQVAAEVTRRGREIIRQMIDWLRGEGATPIEIDTDGIYFTPPEGISTEDEARALVARLSRTLPEGIDVEMDGWYKAMFSYKRKNYALLSHTGEVTIKGSALRSRGIERFLREFLSAMIRLLLEGRHEEINQLVREYRDRLHSHQMDISWLAKTETLTESPDGYKEKVRAKKRNPAAPYELALSSGRDYRAGDQVSYYVTGQGKKVRVYENCKLAYDYDPAHPDVNVAYYEAKLEELLKKFEGFLPSAALLSRREGNKAMR
ncbi:MAG: DNA polymerase domain-containing protein [Thermodesulfobacteriota bacterium]